MLQAVFEPFVQVDMSHARPHGGPGLGSELIAGKHLWRR